MTELGEFAMYMAWGLIGIGSFLGPIAKAAGRWIESKAGAGNARNVQQLEHRVAELEAMLQRTPPGGVPAERMAELEERLDFAERLLAQRSEPERLR
jgi:hypothetical protein